MIDGNDLGLMLTYLPDLLRFERDAPGICEKFVAKVEKAAKIASPKDERGHGENHFDRRNWSI